MEHIQLHVKGMSCNHCVNSIEGAVKALGASAKVDLAKESVNIDYDTSSVSLASIKEAIEDQGYDIV